MGCQAGIVLNPAVSQEHLQWILHRIDFVLVMSVNPGFGGQSLIPEIIQKIKAIHDDYPSLPICIDGGVTLDNIALLASAGASQFVAGTSIFNTRNYDTTIASLRRAAQHA
jgi:ribulose-phosphate 3-epimerase